MKDNKEIRIDSLEQVSGGGHTVTATRGYCKRPERVIKTASEEAVGAVAAFRGLSSLPKILPS